MAYTKQTWTNGSTSTPVNAERLTHMENGIESANGLTQDTVPDGTTYKQYSATEKAKLAALGTSAELRDRATHTGSQAQSTVTNLVTDLAAKAPLANTAVTIFWNATTDTWPSIPAGLPGGTVIYFDSLNDATATPPPNATVGYRWFKKDS